MISSDSIRKQAFHYATCPQGKMHTGQLLTMVCVDASCQSRGLICPVCRLQNHENHQILPVKVFLDQVKDLFIVSSNNDQLNHISDYLRSLQGSRKQMLTSLKQAANSIAESLQQMQRNINSNYSQLRKSILTQSTISTKLPNLVNVLSQASQKDPQQLHTQFKKFASLLRYENSKIKVTDKSKKLVEEYSSLVDQFKLSLTAKAAEFKTNIQGIKVTLNESEVKSSAKENTFTFSPTSKHQSIKIQLNGKLAVTSSDNYDGKVIFVNEGRGDLQQKISFYIQQNYSDMIHLGIGLLQDFKPKNFQYDCFDKLPTHTMALSSGTYEEDKSVNSCSQQSAFTFTQNDTIDIVYSGKNNTIEFNKRNTNQKHSIKLNYTQQQKKKLQFVVGLGGQDKIKILDANQQPPSVIPAQIQQPGAVNQDYEW